MTAYHVIHESPFDDACPTCAGYDNPRHGHVYPWAEVKASKRGGPAPRCRRCGEVRHRDDLDPARGIALGTAIGCALWVLVFAGLAVVVALLTGGNR